MIKEDFLERRYSDVLHSIVRIEVYPTPTGTARAASEHIIRCIQSVESPVIAFATGETMIPVYARLGDAVREGRVSLASIEARELDEYWPCAPTEPHSFVGYHREHVWSLGVPADHIHELDGTAADPEAEARRYGAIVHARPADLMILGIGPWDEDSQTGGHIGFNEPGTPFECGTHVARLHRSTILRDRVGRGQKTPDLALTQGIADILAARHIMMVAYRESKGMALAHALYDPISVHVPASSLRRVGDRVTMYLDQDAASVVEAYRKQSESGAHGELVFPVPTVSV